MEDFCNTLAMYDYQIRQTRSAAIAGFLVHILRLHNSAKPIRQLRQHNPLQFVSTNARNIPIAHRILRNQDIVAPFIRLPRRGADTHMRHVAHEHELALAGALDELLEVGAGKRSGMLLGNDLLAGLGRQLGELFGERGAGREDGRAGGDGVHDVHDGAGGGAVFLKEGGDGGTRGGDVFGGQLAGGIPGWVSVSGTRSSTWVGFGLLRCSGNLGNNWAMQA